MRLKTKPRSMRESRLFRKKARLLFNLSTSSTSCREREGRMFMRTGRGRASVSGKGRDFKYMWDDDSWSFHVGRLKITVRKIHI